MSQQRAARDLRKVADQLGLTMRFTDPAVIAANQQGRLTPEQINLIARKKYPTNAGCLLITVPSLFLLLLVGTYIYLLFQGQLPTNPSAYVVSLALLALIALGVSILVRARAANNRYQQHVAAGNVPWIDRAQGEIIWNQKQGRYALHVPGHDALAFPAFVGDLFRVSLTSYLRPGPYHFYYVKEAEKKDEIIVSAQPIRTRTQMLVLPGTLTETGLPGDEQARLAVQQGLSVSLGFSMADLAANRQGMLTLEQINNLPRKITRQGSFTVRQRANQIQTRVVYVPSDEGPGSNAYFFEVDGLRFQVPQAAQAALGGPGVRHHLYYLDGTDILLSVEALPFQR